MNAAATAEYRALVERLPFADFLGVRIVHADAQGLRIAMPYAPHLIGNTILPALHGGAVAAVIEVAAQLAVMYRLQLGMPPATVDARVDYLRGGRPEETIAEALYVRVGRRVANLRVTAWQAAPDKPIAVGSTTFLLRTGLLRTGLLQSG